MFEIVVEKMISYLTYDMMFALCISVGPLYVDTSVPKMEDVEKRMSSAFSGWVDKGGRWKPTECKARVKVRCELQGSYRSWKTWTDLEFYSGIFQDWKVLEKGHWSRKVLKICSTQQKNMKCMEDSEEN